MDAVAALAPGGGLIAAACTALGLSRASLHRRQAFRRQPLAAVRPRPTPRRALVAKERKVVIDLLRDFYLYVIIDIFSRRVVAWQIADAESAALFKPLFDDAVVKHNVAPGQLTLHADRGGPMKAKATADPKASTLRAIQAALEAAGIEFTNGGQPGVKMKAVRHDSAESLLVEDLNSENDE
jgi:transposase InsO family protein